MIIKTFEISKKKFDKQNFFLIYGENEGLKKEVIQGLLKYQNMGTPCLFLFKVSVYKL